MENGWQFSTEFRTRDPERVARLEAWHSFDEIVDAIMKTNASIELPSPKPLKDDPATSRVEFKLHVGKPVADAFFNSPHGYRSRYLATDSDCSQTVDAPILRRLAAKYRGQLEKRAGALESLLMSQAKLWIRQDARVTRALRGIEAYPPEVAVRSWVERMDQAVRRGDDGHRFLARAGVLAVDGQGVLVVKGGWLKDGRPWADPLKSQRAEQIRQFGFT